MKPKGPAERTIDSVGAAIGLLWDWLGEAPKEEIVPATEEDWLPKSVPPAADGKIPAVVVDTEGENVK